MEKKTTIYDIAQASGYSTTTVALAQNDKGIMPDGRREYIKKLAVEMGYEPNLLAMAMKGVKTKHIGIVINYLDNAFFRSFFKGIEETLDKAGYTYSVSQTRDDLEKEKQYIKKLAQQKVDGIVLLPASQEHEHLDELVGKGIPVVLISHRLPGFPALEADNYRGAQLAAEHMLSLGYQTNIYIAGPTNKSAIKDRMDGYCSVMEGKWGFSSAHVYSVDSLSAEAGYAIMPEILKEASYPMTISVTNDEVAMGVLRYCRQHHIRIPEQIAVSGFSNIDILDSYGIELTTVNIPQKEMGTSAVSLIMQILDDKTYNKEENPVVTLPVNLVIRASTEKPS